MYSGTNHNSWSSYQDEWNSKSGSWYSWWSSLTPGDQGDSYGWNNGQGWSNGPQDFDWEYPSTVWFGSAVCEPFTITSAPQFPLGMALLFAITIPGLTLMKRRFATRAFDYARA